MTPMVGPRGKCERCREERPPSHLRAGERIHLHTGPNGERLCSKHFHEAWEEEYDDE